MTEPHSVRAYFWNQLQWGPCSYFISVRTGKHLCFRANEIKSITMDHLFGVGVVTTVGGYDFKVTSTRAEYIK